MMGNETSLATLMNEMGVRARAAARDLRNTPESAKNEALYRTQENIRTNSNAILQINARDIATAEKQSLSRAMIDRMRLTPERLEGICTALSEIAAQDDPVGALLSSSTRPNGLIIERICVPIGVIGVIYESRPNVTIDAAAIAIKAGNAIILRGGSDCLNTSKALYDCFSRALEQASLPHHSVQFVTTPDRDAVGQILAGLDGNLDLVIPRGGKSLVARVQSDARVPALSHLDGICHAYLDGAADPETARNIVFNAKMRRPGVCGALETLLIDQTIYKKLWPFIAVPLKEAGCELRGDDAICAIDDRVIPASLDDWTTEYLAPILSVAVVERIDGALAHIEQYSSGHTETIITEDAVTAERFLAQVDSAIVMHNASTQFADGGEFGLGAEIGIATGRLHARGPVGVRELTTYKNVVRGTGQIRA